MCLIISNPLIAQKKGVAGGIAGGIAVGAVGVFAAKAMIDKYEEHFEHEATEWVLSNDTLKEFQLKLFDFQASGYDDSDNISAIPFIVRSLNNDKPYVLIFVLSQGWMNEFGIDFTYVKPLIFDKDYWNLIIFNYINISGAVNITNLEEIPLYEKYLGQKGWFSPNDQQLENKEWIKKSRVSQSGKELRDELYRRLGSSAKISQIHDVNNDNIQFNIGLNNTRRIYEYPLREDIDGDTHIISDINDEIMLDFNERDMSIFLKKTSDLFKLKRKMIVEITKELYSVE